MIKHLFTSLILGISMAASAHGQGFSGPYLAATSANIANDYVDAARYYRHAMVNDPDNGFIMQGAMVTSVAAGDFEDGAEIAQLMVDAGYIDAYAQSILIVKAFTDQDFETVTRLLADERFDVSPLIKVLLSGWTLFEQGDIAAAQQAFSRAGENDAIGAFSKYHMALAHALTGDYAAADAIFATGDAYVNRGSILAHAEVLALLGRTGQAQNLLISGQGATVTDRVADNLRRALQAGDDIEFTHIQQASDAVSEAFMVLADALDKDNSARLALFFGRLAQQSQPDNTEALLLIAEILSSQDQHALAIKAYQDIPPDDPLLVNAAIGLAGAFQRNDQMEKAIETLQTLAETNPNDITAWQSLGDLLRRNQNYAEAKDAYTRAIDLLPDPDMAGAWRLYYTRAITEERLKTWPLADRDFRQALALNPDQPDVLNYLGYSLVERGEHLDEALFMIETAVKARPDSGFIADSLGWIYYQLERYEEAVPVMEKAVSLLPVDAVVNDHLGDVFWMVGRQREARFQWRRALSFAPDEADAIRIRQKLAEGLDAVLEAEK